MHSGIQHLTSWHRRSNVCIRIQSLRSDRQSRMDSTMMWTVRHHLTAEDLEKIEKEMKKIVKEALPIERFTKTREEAIAYFKEKDEPYKVELIEDLPEG